MIDASDPLFPDDDRIKTSLIFLSLVLNQWNMTFFVSCILKIFCLKWRNLSSKSVWSYITACKGSFEAVSSHLVEAISCSQSNAALSTSITLKNPFEVYRLCCRKTFYNIILQSRLSDSVVLTMIYIPHLWSSKEFGH